MGVGRHSTLMSQRSGALPEEKLEKWAHLLCQKSQKRFSLERAFTPAVFHKLYISPPSLSHYVRTVPSIVIMWHVSAAATPRKR